MQEASFIGALKTVLIIIGIFTISRWFVQWNAQRKQTDQPKKQRRTAKQDELLDAEEVEYEEIKE